MITVQFYLSGNQCIHVLPGDRLGLMFVERDASVYYGQETFYYKSEVSTHPTVGSELDFLNDLQLVFVASGFIDVSEYFTFSPIKPKFHYSEFRSRRLLHGEVADIDHVMKLRGSHGKVSGFQSNHRDVLGKFEKFPWQVAEDGNKPVCLQETRKWATSRSNQRPRVCRGRHGEVGIMEFGLNAALYSRRYLKYVLGQGPQSVRWRHSIRRPQKPLPRTKHGVDRMHRLRDIRL